LRAIARGDGASIARRVDAIMKYALDNFKRPADPKKTSARTKNYA
jgi:hypothetical protein